MMTVLQISGAEGLRYQSVEPQQQAAGENRNRIKYRSAEAYRSDCFSANASDKHRVYDAHGHPAEFGQHQRRGHRKHGAQFGFAWGHVPFALFANAEGGENS